MCGCSEAWTIQVYGCTGVRTMPLCGTCKHMDYANVQKKVQMIMQQSAALSSAH